MPPPSRRQELILLLSTFLSFLLLVTMSEAKSSGKNSKRWFPLESNPALMNSYVEKLGFDTSIYEFVDVFSTESWALDMIPQPVAAVIMLYPLSDKQEEFAKDDTTLVLDDDASSCWFIKQRIGNACGTIGLLHALLNAPEGLRGAFIRPDSWLSKFYNDCPPALDPVQKAERLESDATIESLHDRATSDEAINQTSRGSLEDRLNTHFVALSSVNGKLLEMDGRKEGPVEHGTTTETSLLQDVCKVVQTFMARDPEEVRFTIMALAPKHQQGV